MSTYLIHFDPETGERTSTYPLDSTVSDARKEELLAQGYELLSEQDFQRLIGNVDGREHYKNPVTKQIEPKPPYVPPLSDVKAAKITELKAIRDKKELDPVDYQGSSFDFDNKSYERITAAIYALEGAGTSATINWTLADNGSLSVTAADLRGVIAAAVVRSDALHTRYRGLKEAVQAAQTVEEVEKIIWPED